MTVRVAPSVSMEFTCSTNCGNGQIEPPEECDDGNPFDGDGCQSNCTVAPFCNPLDPEPVCGTGLGCYAFRDAPPTCGPVGTGAEGDPVVS